LGARAREFNRLIAPLASTDEPVLISKGPPELSIVVARCKRIDWTVYSDLDASEGDAKIIAEILNVCDIADDEKIVISQDINPLILARNYNVKTLHAPETWLPRPDPSPHEKEIAKLKRQINDYQKIEPAFSLSVDFPVECVKTYKIEPLVIQQAIELQNTILAFNPKPVQESSIFSSMLYDHSLNERYENYSSRIIPKFVEKYHNKLELVLNQLPFTLTVENIGNVRADNMIVDIKIIGGWLNEKPVMLFPSGPSAPRVEDRLNINRHLNYGLVKPLIVGRHEVDLKSSGRTSEISAHCADFRHGQKWEFSGFIWLDPDYDREPLVLINVTAANLHGVERTTAPINRKLLKTKVTNIVDLNRLKFLVEPCIFQLTKSLIENKNFSAIEWDKIDE
jgi:hypothetical protein